MWKFGPWFERSKEKVKVLVATSRLQNVFVVLRVIFPHVTCMAVELIGAPIGSGASTDRDLNN
jgi:hypothetical protein